jgi:amidase
MADPSGSSSGSAICSAIGLAAFALGTETDGSIVSPSSRNNLVGIKPTVGLTSRAGGQSSASGMSDLLYADDMLIWKVIPISVHQDTIGPIARSVTDAAIVLSIMAGQDPLDNFTSIAPQTVPDYTKALNKNGLKGVRLGIPRLFQGSDPNIIAAFNQSLTVFKELGATIVDGTEFPSAQEMLSSKNVETTVLTTDFKVFDTHSLPALLE